jgi:hypothetical protein
MAWADLSLAENLRVGKLQMDWLRSEDLKEEKIETNLVANCSTRKRARLILSAR